MLVTDVYKIPIGLSLALIVVVLGVAMAASWFWPREDAEPASDHRDAADRRAG
jgi:hypothetical protein